MVTGRQKLLLADDSITIQKVVSLTFADEGMDVATASDGDQAIRLLEENVPDIVLADVFMPGRNGYEVCEHIKGDKRFRHIPVMLLVGAFEPFNEAEARRVGADDVLTKPFQSIRNLVNRVGSLLGGGQHADQNADTLDLAPSLSPPREPAATDTSSRDAVSDQHAHVAHDPTASFADLDMDDALIEATPAEKFGYAREASVMERGLSEDDAARMSHDDDDEQQIPLVVMRPDSAAEESPAPANMEDTLSLFDEEQMPEQRQETQPFMSSQEELSPAPALEHAHAARPAFAAHGSSPSDDSLLDLDSVESPSSAAAAVDDDNDDFILDLTDEISPRASTSAANTSAATDVFDLADTSAATSVSDVYAAEEFAPVSVEPEAAPQVDYAGAFAEAAHGSATDDETPTVIVEAPVEATFGEQWSEPARGDASPVHDDASATPDYEMSMPPSDFDATEATPEVVEPSDVLYAGDENFAPVQEQAPAAGFAPASEFAPVSEEWNLDIGGATESANASETASADSRADSAGATATAFPVEAGRDDSQAASLASPTLSNAASQSLTAEQLSPEIIDAIARRAVEQLSEKVVREIAWEVVPQLAELLIKRRLDEEKARQQ